MKYLIEKAIKNKYNYVVIIQILTLIFNPSTETFKTRFPLVTLMTIISVMVALWSVSSKKMFNRYLLLVIPTFIFHCLITYKLINLSHKITIITLTLYSTFFLIAIIKLINAMSKKTTITQDTIKCGISVYILIGLLWSIFYLMINIINPESFTAITNSNDYIYYSFVTLTTLGYGDISAQSNIAKSMSILEAVIGQLYLAIFVAQLIGMRIASRSRSK